MKVEEKRIEEVQVAFIGYTGSYEKIPELMEKVIQWTTAKGLQMTGMVYGTYYNSPEDVAPENLVYEIGVSVTGEVEPEGKMGIKKIPEYTALSAMHKGPYTQVGPVIHGITEYAINNGYDIVGPVTEVYLNTPMEVKEEELLTEVRFPVIKK